MPLWAGDVMALVCALAWAGAVLLFRRAASADADGLNLFKNAFASVLLLLTLGAMGIWFQTDRAARDWILLIGSGVLGLAIADTLFLAGLRRIDASVAAVADCVYSPTVVVLSAIFLKEGLGLGVAVGAPLVVLGLLFVGWQPRSARVAGERLTPAVDRKGVILAVVGVLTTAVGVVLAKPALERSNLVEATTVRLLSGTVALFLFQVVTGRAAKALAMFRPQPIWKAIVPATLLGTYIAMILWLGGMKYGSASRAALLNQTGAIMVLVLSRFTGEAVPRRRWIGAGVAVTGVCLVLAIR